MVGGYRNIVPDAEDHDLWLRIADHFELANLKEVVLKYRLHPFQVTVRKCRQMAISGLAAIAAAASRRNGKADPLDSETRLTPAVLSQLGVSEAKLRASIAGRLLRSVQNMYAIGEYSVAMGTFTEALHSSDWKYANARVIADLHLLGARLFWRQNRFGQSIVSAVRAFVARPLVLGRPLRGLLRCLVGNLRHETGRL